MDPLRRATIRLANSQPKGSKLRKALLDVLAGSRITVRDLEAVLGNESPDGDLEALAKKLNSARGSRAVNKVLREANRVLKTYGVEAIWEEGEYRTPAAVYLNTGDTYATTLVYDEDNDELFVGTWGDWVEEAEREGRQMRAAQKQISDRSANMDPLRRATIRLANSQPKGSKLRKALLDVLAQEEFNPEEIGELESGPMESDSDEPFMGDHFTEQENRELSEMQEAGRLASDAELRKATIRLAHSNPKLRKHLLPLLKD